MRKPLTIIGAVALLAACALAGGQITEDLEAIEINPVLGDI